MPLPTFPINYQSPGAIKTFKFLKKRKKKKKTHPFGFHETIFSFFSPALLVLLCDIFDGLTLSLLLILMFSRILTSVFSLNTFFSIIPFR